jgi:outer membrane murein-binding lipoprotein Lpp
MGFLDKAKQAAEQAAARAKEGVEDVQTKRELSQAYHELGKTTFGLIESGDISDSRLDAQAERIRTLTAKVAADASTNGGDTSEEYDASQPPAMPT